MGIAERAGLIARVKLMRRTAATTDLRQSTEPPRREDALEARVAHLEEMLQGLQDSVHREFERQNKRITELENRMEPAALAQALSKDARERGL
jgi:exonuclease VII large subunit